MIRRIIKIDQELCNGCGICAEACHEGAIAMVNGKAQLLRDDYCDGLGDCLPTCPTGAISFEEREALPYDEEAVLLNMKMKEEQVQAQAEPMACGCPGSQARSLEKSCSSSPAAMDTSERESQLAQWPVQIKLVSIEAPYFNNADLLIAADCTAYAYAGFHERFMSGKITLIGCPKLDEGNYAEKLTAILSQNNIKSVTVTRMQVPCCGGIERAVEVAVANSGKQIPLEIVTLSSDGKIID